MTTHLFGERLGSLRGCLAASPWAMVLAGIAALLILIGLALPDPPVRERVYTLRGHE